MSAIINTLVKIKAEEFANLTAEKATEALGINERALRVTGIGGAVFYKIGNEFYMVGGYRGDKFLWVNGGAVEGKTVLLDQLTEEFQEETFGQLLATKNGKVQDIGCAYIYKFGTYISFVYTDSKSFSSKEELDACIEKMNRPAKFYNELFLHVTAHMGTKTLSPEEHNEKTEALIKEYHRLKNEGLLLVDVAENKEEKFLEELRALKNVGGVKEWYKTENNTFIKDYNIGEYSERSHYEAVPLDELKARLDADKDLPKEKSSFFLNHTQIILALMPEIETALKKELENTMAPRVYSGRPGSPTLYQAAPVAAAVDEAQKSTFSLNHV